MVEAASLTHDIGKKIDDLIDIGMNFGVLKFILFSIV